MRPKKRNEKPRPEIPQISKAMGNDRHNKQRVLFRTVFLMAALGVGVFVFLIISLFDLQINQNEKLLSRAVGQQTRDLAVSANRGTVYDNEGNIFAMSATVHNLILSPRDLDTSIQKNEDIYKEYLAETKPKKKEKKLKEYNEHLDRDYIAMNLARLTGLDAQDIRQRMERHNSAHEILLRKLEPEESEPIRAFLNECKLDDEVYLEPDSKRYYPYGTLASHVVGFVGGENKGLYGVETIYERDLSGESGRVIVAKNGAGKEMLSSYENFIDAQDGLDHHLTINATIQGFAEKTLQEGIEKYDIQNGGFCIVMDPKTGGILAMASSPGYDLSAPFEVYDPEEAQALEEMKNDPAVDENSYKKALGNAQLAQWRNRCVNDTYEPGSTFKSIVVAAALEEGVVDLNSQFYCNGAKKVADHTIHCAKREGHGSENLAKAVLNSCNPAFIEIGQKLGAKRFYDYMEDFGLLEPTGIDLNGESSGVIWSRKLFESEEGISSLATASFGQTFRITPIQLITAASAVVNGGHLMVPHVLDYTADKDGNIIDTYPVTEARQVISEQTSATVCSILEGVVGAKEGTGRNAYQPGYCIGGKTGTSEKIGADQNEDDYIVSFLGLAPANDPKVVVLLAYDTPKPSYPGSSWTAGGTYISGGNMAAPMAGPLLRQILDYMGVEKQYSAEELSGADTTVPLCVGYTESQAAQVLKARRFTYRLIGSGEKVTGQIPVSGSVIPGGSEILLYMGEEKPAEAVEMPNLTGRDPDSARQALSRLNLYMRGTGSAQFFTSATLCANQSIAPGTLVEPGTVVDVTFVENVTDFTQN